MLPPENILSPRSRRELRILICFNWKKRNDIDSNTSFYNANKVPNHGQGLDKSKHLDIYKNKLIQFKCFLWPNYRIEDLACMNRYWFDTTNGSRFSMIRIRLYPQLKKKWINAKNFLYFWYLVSQTLRQCIYIHIMSISLS